ncbi:MAG TPA: cyclic nucleotide-binding domain-containing protein [Clostridia bacterium]|nr:cyclic nucleotide-binding domain-containing protein [Clostridia bacterium]
MSYELVKKYFPYLNHYIESERSPGLEERRWQKGDFICHAGESISYMHFITRGKARVFLPLYNGKQFLFRIYQPGAVVGDLEFFTGGNTTCAVQCISQCHTYCVPMDTLRRNSNINSILLFSLGRILAEKLERNSIAEAINTHYDLAARVAAYYLTHTDPRIQAGSLQELSEWLGTSYRHLARIHTKLVKTGALKKENRTYKIKNRPLLKQYSDTTLLEGTHRLS